ncbi:hypothetical protein GQ53DRAFT_759030 [Thozetella sp. PMI_491]|nr:hypothetical protein GQ53DRAFT_759030 [Thozetella sp. PMI_491]
MNTVEANKLLPSVPRSKGCITCVSRKVRCDGRRPGCKNCEDRKQQCQGYRRAQFTFLNEGWKPLGVASKATTRPKPAETDALARTHFGRVNGDRTREEEGIRIYASALRCMSKRVPEILGDTAGVLPEQDWHDLVFSCLLMAFWELFETMSSRPKTLHNEPQRLHLLYRASGKPLYPAGNDFRDNTESFSLPTATTPPDSFEVVIKYLSETSALRQKYYDLLDVWCDRGQKDLSVPVRSWCRSLTHLYHQGKSILQKVDQFLALPLHFMRALPLAFRIERWKDCGLPDHVQRAFRTATGDPDSPFATIIEFDDMEKNLLISLFWTTAITLRILLCDVLSSIRTLAPHSDEPGYHGVLRRHRAALLRYAQSICSSIPYMSLPQNLRISPFHYAPAFQLGHTVLARECHLLSLEDAQAELERCCKMKDVVQEHLEWVSRKKILIRVDLELPQSGIDWLPKQS